MNALGCFGVVYYYVININIILVNIILTIFSSFYNINIVITITPSGVRVKQRRLVSTLTPVIRLLN